MLKDADIDTIRRSVTMRQLAEKYNYKVNRAGFAKCPFHQDNSPSMKVYDADRGYYCFVCKAGGSIFDFVMEHDGLEFEPAARHIAELFGIPIADGNKPLSGREKKRISKQIADREFDVRMRKMAEDTLNATGALLVRYRSYQAEFEPLGGMWCRLQELIDRCEALWEEQFEELYPNRNRNAK